MPRQPLLSNEGASDESSPLADCHRDAEVLRWSADDKQRAISQDQVAVEAAVALSYNGISHAVMMATPQNLEDFALGFSLSEGILQSASELYDLEIENHPEGVEVSMTISAQRLAELKQRRRNLTGRTGCGLCGTESLCEAIKPTQAVPNHPSIDDQAIQRAISELPRFQPLQAICGAVHGAAWCNAQGQIHFAREDVGRHNALDKLIGTLQREGLDTASGFVLVTSRASYEMVQKTTSQGIGTLVAVSAPTSLAIDLAKASGLTLVGFARPGRHVSYT